jgi:hypothetical protein
MSSPFIEHGRTRHFQCRVQSFVHHRCRRLVKKVPTTSSREVLFFSIQSYWVDQIYWIKALPTWGRAHKWIEDSTTVNCISHRIAFSSPFRLMSYHLLLPCISFDFVSSNRPNSSFFIMLTIFSSVIFWLTFTYRVPDDYNLKMDHQN